MTRLVKNNGLIHFHVLLYFLRAKCGKVVGGVNVTKLNFCLSLLIMGEEKTKKATTKTVFLTPIVIILVRSHQNFEVL